MVGILAINGIIRDTANKNQKFLIILYLFYDCIIINIVISITTKNFSLIS